MHVLYVLVGFRVASACAWLANSFMGTTRRLHIWVQNLSFAHKPDMGKLTYAAYDAPLQGFTNSCSCAVSIPRRLECRVHAC